ncbi:MAG: 50S ribosomal protein L37ae [Candidatus Marsarchaeota archaeon]|nr:50S ribosomal protein L37ae [Candidatus Marsarchaeota archaeon]
MSDFNVRYGMELRKRADATAATRRAKYACPRCSKAAVKRISNALWKCQSCGAKFAGATYALSTPAGEVASRLIEDFKAREKRAGKA